jgi:DNA-binding SARP family transcriptional activator
LLFRLGAKLEPVARDELTLLFWPELDDRTARLNLRRLLSFARRNLPASEALIATSDSVMLEPHLVWSDAHALETLLHADNLEGWQASVDLYSGPFLSGFYLRNTAEYELWQSATTERLRNCLLERLGKLVDHHVACGDRLQAVHYARRYLEIDNLAESIHRELIALYAQMGKRDLALHQFEECMLVLERELGVEPLPETRAAYKLALQGRTTLIPAKTAHVPTYNLLPTLELPLIGREAELRQLANAYARLRHGGFIVVSGESGIGKSRLVQAFAEQASALILTGHCHQGTESLPYYPVAEMLRQAVANTYFGQGVSQVWLAELELLMPDLRMLFPNLPEHSERRSQSRLQEALVQLLLGLAARQQLILYFDDMHLADSTTITWLQYASNRLRSSRVCIIASSADTNTASFGPLVKTMEKDGTVTRIELDGLTVDAVFAMLHTVKSPGAQDETTARRLHEASGGNTFYVLELIRELIEANLLDAPPHQLPVSKTLQQTIDRRISRLSPTARQVLETAAVLDPELDFDLVHATTGRDETEVSEGLEEIVKHQLLRYNSGRLRFQHSIVRATVYASLRVWRRHLLHQRAADALIRLGVKRGDYLSAAVAAHYAAAGNKNGALHHYWEACLRAQRYSSARAAAQYATDAITLIGPSTPPQTVASLYEALGDSLSLLGQFDAARAAFRNATLRLVPTSSLQTVGLMVKSAALLILQAEFTEASTLLRQALLHLERLPQSHNLEWWQGWIDVRMQQARIFSFRADLVALAEAVKELSAAIRDYGTPRQQRFLLDLVQSNEMQRGATQSSEGNLLASRRCALEDATERGCPQDIVAARFEYGDALLCSHRLTEADIVLSTAYDEACAFDFTVIQLECASRLLILYRLQGQVEQAEVLCPKVLALSDSVGIPFYEGVARAQEAWLLLRRGDPATAFASATRALTAWEKQQFPMRWLALWVVLTVQVGIGQIADAVQSAWNLLEGNQQAPLPDVESALSHAVDSWTIDAVQQAAEFLRTAVELSYIHHYM